MRVLVIVSILSLLLYVVTQPACQYRALRQATGAAEQGRFDEALTHLLPLFQETPCYFHDQAQTLCGQIMIQQAQALATQSEPDFNEATRLLLSQTQLCQGYESPQTQPLLEKVAALHLAYGTTRCEQKDYESALRVFQAITTLAYPERFQHEAKEEEGWCRLALANTLTEGRWFAEALGELHRAMESGNPTVRRAALKQVPFVVWKEVVYWIERRQYIEAFSVFNERQQHFGWEPEVASFFPRLESLMQMQVFGKILTQPCLGKADKPKGQRPVLVVAVDAHPSGFAKTNVTLHNNTAFDLQVLLRGPEDDALHLKPHETKPLWLEPGDYLVGMFAPGKCRVQPKQTAWTVEPFVHQTIEVVLQGAD
jgi:hypothetical protein